MATSTPTVHTAPHSNSAAVRSWLVDETRLDLIGPGLFGDDGELTHPELHSEALPQAPSRWYLSGYLVPLGAAEEDRAGDADTEGDLDSAEDAEATDDAAQPDRASARKAWRPSSIGMSFLLPEAAASVQVEVVWGDYRLHRTSAAVVPVALEGADNVPAAAAAPGLGDERRRWERSQRREVVPIDVNVGDSRETPVKNSDGLYLSVLVRTATMRTEAGAVKVKAVSVFLVNRRLSPDDRTTADEAAAFQAGLTVRCQTPFLPRPDVHGLNSADPDDRIADLHYADVAELAVGHNVSADWETDPEGGCRRIWSTWAPAVAVPRVVPNESISGFTLAMETLGALADATAARVALTGVVQAYRDWIAVERGNIPELVLKRREMATQLLDEAEAAVARIEDGIAALAQPDILEAFKIANRAVARAARQREGQIRGVAPSAAPAPGWRPFQLAFLLLNLRGLAEPTHGDRALVDLLFFPTGGGKTEAYLGLAAFSIAHRRLTHPGMTGAGVTVLMRYTLRLLTLDQLSRAAGVVCALELERQAGAKLGEWPIEIGLWVGRAATPNRMGHVGDHARPNTTARQRVVGYMRNTTKAMPIPLKNCPWCGTGFDRNSFRLVNDVGRADTDNPTNLELRCVNRDCVFQAQPLPVLTVDEPIYRRLPAFMIATVDKFAGMPWTGEIAGFFGGATRFDGKAFRTAASPAGGAPLPSPLPPPDLIIQDELHLISGPLGTMAGLYETAIDRLCCRVVEGKTVRPKIVASTATVRRAEKQIRGLFGRQSVAVFPPPGPDRRDSFFAKMLSTDDPGSRLYLGLAAPGGSPKVVFLRTLVTIMAAAQTAWSKAAASAKNPADPYMTLVAYFNALRELGGSRRIVEGEVGPRLRSYSRRARLDQPQRFQDRQIQYEVMELTSRESTDKVSEAKRRLALPFAGKDHVDVALATNMISVGLDITRLGLMVVEGQPKTAAEYIQATSRVGRDATKPGLVITLLNANKPRDRSHYERFRAWHTAFYRSVEACSVTPFSPRALDRGLPAVVVGLSRLLLPDFTPSRGAQRANGHRGDLDPIADTIADRAAHSLDKGTKPAERQNLRDKVRNRVADILDDWSKVAADVQSAAGDLGYQKQPGVGTPLLREMLDDTPLPPHQKRFRAPRSLRDVEPSVLVKLKTFEGQDLED